MADGERPQDPNVISMEEYRNGIYDEFVQSILVNLREQHASSPVYAEPTDQEVAEAVESVKWVLGLDGAPPLSPEEEGLLGNVEENFDDPKRHKWLQKSLDKLSASRNSLRKEVEETSG